MAESTISEQGGSARTAVSMIAWPGLFVVCMTLAAVGMARDQGALWFNLTYLGLAVTLALLERVMPHERAWLKLDDQILPDLLHTVLTKGLVQLIVIMTAVFGVASLLSEAGGPYWPSAWPFFAQVILGLVIAEFGMYWAHRIAHEFPPIWRFHAVHHSVEKLWFFNTGRFHFMDTAFSLLLSQPLIILAGAPADIVIWVGMTTAFIGMLTHCNVEMRTGLLDYVFNTPALHRWHHSRDPEEGNTNYGENLMLWDLVFRTWYRPGRRPPANIGIDQYMPRTFTEQLLHPFRRQG